MRILSMTAAAAVLALCSFGSASQAQMAPMNNQNMTTGQDMSNDGMTKPMMKKKRMTKKQRMMMQRKKKMRSNTSGNMNGNM